MPRVKKLDLGMTALDELFMDDKERAENKLPKIFDIPLSEIDDFPGHPYRVLDDEDMQKLMESIKDRGVTYRTGSLFWDKAASVRPDGSAELSFFETLYKNVNADNAERVLAPGTEKDSVIRLKNDTNKEITYTAVLYSLSTSPDLNIGATLSGDGFSDTSRYALPESIKKETVVRAVGGSLAAKKLQDFDINWFWNYEDGANIDERDRVDTYLGNKAASGKADDVTLGFYIVIRDGGEIVPSPSTGDNTMIGGYVVLMLISGGLCLFLALTRKRREKVED